MLNEWLKAVILLPFNVLVIIPALILYFGGYKYIFNGFFSIISGGLLLITGIIFYTRHQFLQNLDYLHHFLIC